MGDLVSLSWKLVRLNFKTFWLIVRVACVLSYDFLLVDSKLVPPCLTVLSAFL